MQHDYYSLGVAHGLYFIYNMFHRFQDRDFKGVQIMELLVNTASQYKEEDKIKEYFDRLIKDLDEK